MPIFYADINNIMRISRLMRKKLSTLLLTADMLRAQTSRVARHRLNTRILALINCRRCAGDCRSMKLIARRSFSLAAAKVVDADCFRHASWRNIKMK